jgi:hypothetical protein
MRPERTQKFAGITSLRQPESDHRCLHAGGQSTEARGSEEAGEDGDEKDCLNLTGSNWIMKKNREFAEALYFVGVPDGI